MPESNHARKLREEGFAVFEGAVAAPDVERVRAAIRDRLAETGYEGPRFASGMTPLGDTYALSYSGVNFWRILSERPELVDLVLRPVVVDVMKEVLGDDVHLEMVSAAVADGERTFLPWHTHIGGFDDSHYPRDGDWPLPPSMERITTILYLEDIAPGPDGPLLVYPRGAEDPVAAPGPREREWEGQVPVPVSRGTIVALEQRTWHAALPMSRSEPRVGVCCLFRRGDVEAPAWADTSLSKLGEASPLLASLSRPPAPGAPEPPMPCRTHLESKKKVRERAGAAETPMAPAEAAAVETLLASLNTSMPEGWEAVDGRIDPRVVLMTLSSGEEEVTLEIVLAGPDTRAFRRHAHLAYSHRGSLDPDAARALGPVIDALHPCVAAWWDQRG